MNQSLPNRNAIPAEDPAFADVLRDTLRFLRRRFVRMMALGLLFALIAFVISLQMERLYKSSIQLMIDKPLASPIEAEAQPLLRTDTSYVDGQVLQIGSDDLLLRVIEREALTEVPAFQATPANRLQQIVRDLKALLPRPKVIAEGNADAPDPATLTALKILAEAVTVSREGDTNVVSIDVRTVSPGLARRIASAIAAAYIDLRLEQRQVAAREMSAWIDERAYDLRAQLAQAEAAVTAYRIDNNLIGEVDGATLGDQQLMELNAELIRSRADAAQKRASYELAVRLMEGGGDPSSLPEVQNSAIISTLRETRLELQRDEEEIAQIGGQNSPRLVQVRRQIELLDAQIDLEVRRIATVLENETAALESRTRLLAEALERAGGQSELESQVSVELRELERVAESYRQRYERYLNSAGLATELSTFASSGTTVIRAATFPLAPFYPPTKLLVILSVLFGMVVALLSSLLHDAMVPGFRSVEQIESDTGLTVLAVLPELEARQGALKVVTNDPYAPFSEAISVLRQGLHIKSGAPQAAGAVPVLLITSACEGEGKTSIAAALAVSASEGGSKVLLVDGDLRYAGLSELFDMDGGDGFCDILRGSRWQAPEGANSSILDVIPAGDLRDASPAHCLGSENLPRFLSNAKHHYDLIIIDGTPVVNLADSTILAENATQVLVVLRVKTTSEVFRNALRRLPFGKIAGIVVNRVDLRDESGNWVSGGVYSTSQTRSASIHQLRNSARHKTGRSA